jgi:hypothetical protein
VPDELRDSTARSDATDSDRILTRSRRSNPLASQERPFDFFSERKPFDSIHRASLGKPTRVVRDPARATIAVPLGSPKLERRVGAGHRRRRARSSAPPRSAHRSSDEDRKNWARGRAAALESIRADLFANGRMRPRPLPLVALIGGIRTVALDVAPRRSDFRSASRTRDTDGAGPVLSDFVPLRHQPDPLLTSRLERTAARAVSPLIHFKKPTLPETSPSSMDEQASPVVAVQERVDETTRARTRRRKNSATLRHELARDVRRTPGPPPGTRSTEDDARSRDGGAALAGSLLRDPARD